MNNQYLKIFIKLDSMPVFRRAVEQTRRKLDLPPDGFRPNNGKNLDVYKKQSVDPMKELKRLRELANDLLQKSYPGNHFEKGEWRNTYQLFYSYLFWGVAGVKNSLYEPYGVEIFPVKALGNGMLLPMLQDEYKGGFLLALKPGATQKDIRFLIKRSGGIREILGRGTPHSTIKGKNRSSSISACKETHIKFGHMRVGDLRPYLRKPGLYSRYQGLALIASEKFGKKITTEAYMKTIQRLKKIGEL